MYKVFIVEDDPAIASLLRDNLEKWGYSAECVKDFSNIVGEFSEYEPHIVLLDVSLPFYNGYYFCSEIRKISKVPIVFISSHTENMDIIMAMNMGADDYITKPFSLDIAIAKINAVLRRTYSYFGETKLLEVGGAVLNLSDASLCVNGEKVDLTKNEFRILHLLMERKNSVVSREEIMAKLWDSDQFVDDNTLTVNINRLRKKLEDNGLADFITTKKGLGYMVHD